MKIIHGPEAFNKVTGRSILQPPDASHKVPSPLSRCVRLDNDTYWAPAKADLALNPRIKEQWQDDFRFMKENPIYDGEKYHGVITTRKAIRFLQAAEWATFDFETTNRLWDRNLQAHCVGISTSRGDTFVVADLINVADLFAACDLWIGHNVKFDMHVARNCFDVTVSNVEDTLVLWRLLFPGLRGRLGNSSECVGMGGYKQEFEKLLASAARAAKVKNYEAYGLVDREKLFQYCAKDAACTARLYRLLNARVDYDGVRKYYDSLIKPATKDLWEMEHRGVLIDMPALQELNRRIGISHGALLKTLHQYMDNPNSPKQVMAALHKVGCKVESTGVEILEELDHPLAKRILEYRKLEKLRGSFIESILDSCDADSVVHTTLNLGQARSGRQSSSDPNMQQLPRPTDKWAIAFAECFIARPGKYLVAGDFKQIEIVVAATLAADKDMLAVIKSGADFHTETAHKIMRYMGWREITPEERTQTKRVNFGLLYGKTARGLSHDIGVDVHTAETLIKAIFGAYKGLHKYIKTQHAFAREHGYVQNTWQGMPAKKRPLLYAVDGNFTELNAAVNTPIQGLASDYGLHAISKLRRFSPILTVHDSVICEVTKKSDAATIKKIMENNDMGISCDVKIGMSFKDLK